jgi:predicted TIM-barrel fold metal-dependent hydrolase
MRFVRRVAAVAKTGADIQHAMAAGEEGSPFAPSFVPARVLYSLMLGGVFDRYPELHFAVTETRADWVPATLDLLDRRFAAEATSPKKRPSEYWQSNCYAGVSSIKESEVRLRERIGTDRMMFGRDYPHPEGTWPNTWDWLRDALRGITEDDVRALVGLNAIECYRLDARELGVIADRIGPRPEDVMRDAPCVDDRVVTHFDHRSGYHQTYEVVDEHALNALVSEDLALAAGR